MNLIIVTFSSIAPLTLCKKVDALLHNAFFFEGRIKEFLYMSTANSRQFVTVKFCHIKFSTELRIL